ncbi:hypothetical protein FRB90_007936 [Tulasnella sp. 427]|nr:hypothetical protein FRB90_007936 [Tulasnella sp. 427]
MQPLQILIFTVLRPRFRAIYEPRTYVPDEGKRVEPFSKSMLLWPLALFKLDYQDIKRTNGIDAYFFVRFLRMMVIIFLPAWLLSWALFLPLYGAGTTNGKTGLDRFTFGNVSPSQQARYAGTIIFMFFFTPWILYNIKKEMRHFITTRQRHLVDPEHSKTAQANTVLVTGVPRKFLDEAVLAQLFSHLPGGAKAIWLNRDLKDMPDVYERRLKACNKLESAEKALLQTATKLHLKGKSPTQAAGGKPDPNLPLAEQLVPRDQRPTHRLPPFKFLPFGLPFMGEKVDSIDWAKKEIVETNRILEESRAKLKEDIDRPGVGDDEHYPPLNSAFILFNQQIAAHLAAQSLTHNEPYRMADKFTEVAPEDVIWHNLGLNPYEKRVRTAISYAITAALIIFWAIPVAFVGIVSNVYGLCTQYKWLAWICKLPSVVVGLLQGILPPVLLAVLMALLPIILRLLAHFEGIPRRSGLELSLMTRYFIFQVIHSFLIVTLSGGIIQALPGLLNNPASVPTLLASNLPQASTFFLTYITLQGLTGAAGGILQIVPLILYYVKLIILGSTPRSIYKIKFVLRNVAWGTTFPSVTLIVVIALVYTPLQPITAGLAFATFALFYKLWTYLFLYVLDQPASGDTGGLFFPKAINHIFVGLYIQQVCLAALFFLSRNQNRKASAVPEGALMIVLIVFTYVPFRDLVFRSWVTLIVPGLFSAAFHFVLNQSYGPLLHSLPLTLAHKSYGMPRERSLPSGEPEDDMAQENADADADEAAGGKKRAVAIHDTRGGGTDGFDKARRIEGADDDNDIRPMREPSKNMPTDFNHPATVEPQRPIWIPRDEFGLAEAEAKAMMAEGIDVSMKDAEMNEKGKINIDGRPPNDMI